MSKDLTEIQHVIEQMKDIKTTIEQLNERYDALKTVVIEHLDGNTEGDIDGTTVVKYATTTQYRVNTDWLKTNMPQVYEEARKPVTSTSFRLVYETRDA